MSNSIITPFISFPPDILRLILSQHLSVKEIVYFGLCCRHHYSYVFSNIQMWHKDRWYLPFYDGNIFPKLFKAEISKEIKYRIGLAATYTDGGEYSSYYGLKNLCDDNLTSCYCTNKTPENVNVIIQLVLTEEMEADRENIIMFVRKIDLLSPTGGYTAPLKESLVFLTLDQPNPADYDFYNGLTEEKYNELYDSVPIRIKQEKLQPIVYHKCKTVTFNEVLPSGRYFLLKLLRSGGDRVNIDVHKFRVTGFLYDIKKNVLLNSPETQPLVKIIRKQ